MIQVSRWKIGAVILAFLLGVWFTLPNLLPASVKANAPFLPKQTLNLGLDLQGGSYLLYSVDIDKLQQEKISNLADDIRDHLQNAGIGFSGFEVSGQTITLHINDPAQVQTAYQAVQKLSSPLPGAGTGRDFDVSTGPNQTLTIVRSDQALRVTSAGAIDQSIEIVRRRVDSLGTREPAITRQGADRIVIEAAGESDPEALKRVIGQTAKLTFQMVDDTVSLQEAAAGNVPPGSTLLPTAPGNHEPAVVVRNRVLVSGENLVKANVGQDQTQQPAIDFSFDAKGAHTFATVTANNLGKRFAIILDGKVLSAPIIQGVIPNGNGQITGNFTIEGATELVNLLNGGALPAPLKVEEQRTVGAELGADAVEAGKTSTMVAFLSIVVFMFLAYGFLFGGIAVAALVVNAFLIIAAMSVTQATLTLPGIAGLILTLAVAVDANVLIYERMRDEIRSGRSPVMAAQGGFSKAMVTIMDANITTLVAAAIMFEFGSGPVRGFAWTLFIGVVTSVFTAVMVTQVLIALWLRHARPKTLPIS